MVQKIQPDFSSLINYLGKLSNRISEIEDQSRMGSNEVDSQSKYLKHSESSIKNELEHLKKGTEKLKNSFEKQKEIIKRFANDFKGIAKKERLERLKENIDEWNPESYITRKELKKKLEKTD